VTVPEVRRLLIRLAPTEPADTDRVLRRSLWRRRHQARANDCHRRRRAMRYQELRL
jgi:hypothetical protein